MKSAKLRIKKYLKEREVWINGGKLERDEYFLPNKPSYIAREARRLAEDEMIERKLDGKSVWYRAKPTPQPVFTRNSQGDLLVTLKVNR